MLGRTFRDGLRRTLHEVSGLSVRLHCPAQFHLDDIASPGGKGSGAAFEIELPAPKKVVTVPEPRNSRAFRLHPFGPDPAGAGVILTEGVTVQHPQPGLACLMRYGSVAGQHAARKRMLADEIRPAAVDREFGI